MKYILITIASSILSIVGTILTLNNFPELWPKNSFNLDFRDDNENTRVAIGKYQLDQSGVSYGLSFHDSAGNVRMILGTKEDDSPFIVLQNEDLSYAGGLNVAMGNIQLLLGSIKGNYVQLAAPSHLKTKSGSAINISGGDATKSEITILAAESPSIVLNKDSYQSLMVLRLAKEKSSIIVKKDGHEVFKTTD